jgi:hypothetical protein
MTAHKQTASWVRAMLFAMASLCSASAGAQSFSASISPADGNIGKVVSAASGTTTYTISATSGSVNRTGGSGLPVSAASTRAQITISCTGVGNRCGDNRGSTVTATVKVEAFGTPAGRALPLTNFTAAPGTVSPSLTQGSGASITFTIEGSFRNGATHTFYLGADLPISSTGTTGEASSQYLLTISGEGNPSGSASNGSFSATVHRPIALARDSDLAFGTIARPTTGTNRITINQGTGNRTITGSGDGALVGGGASRAALTVSGEGGQAISIAAPSTLVMTQASGGTLTANLVTSNSSDALSGGVGSSGTATISVGGSLDVSHTTEAGGYTGTFLITVQYN